MKNSMLIDCGLPVYFWVEAMDTANYLHNRLLTKPDGSTIILEEAWTNVRQNPEYMRIFESRLNTFISTQKYSKSDIRKT